MGRMTYSSRLSALSPIPTAACASTNDIGQGGISIPGCGAGSYYTETQPVGTIGTSGYIPAMRFILSNQTVQSDSCSFKVGGKGLLNINAAASASNTESKVITGATASSGNIVCSLDSSPSGTLDAGSALLNSSASVRQLIYLMNQAPTSTINIPLNDIQVSTMVTGSSPSRDHCQVNIANHKCADVNFISSNGGTNNNTATKGEIYYLSNESLANPLIIDQNINVVNTSKTLGDVSKAFVLCPKDLTTIPVPFDLNSTKLSTSIQFSTSPSCQTNPSVVGCSANKLMLTELSNVAVGSKISFGGVVSGNSSGAGLYNEPVNIIQGNSAEFNYIPTCFTDSANSTSVSWALTNATPL